MKWSLLLVMLLQFATFVISNECRFAERATLQQPRHLTSSTAKWRVTLRAQPANITVDWLSLERRTYNGSVPAPTIRLKQGDELEILLLNDLPKTVEGGKLNQLRFPDSTNLHLHGLHIDSKVPGDNVLIRIKPGQEYLYSYKIEDDQPAGTYWYHPHLHGSTILQVNSGMAGMLIVEDSNQATSDQLKAVTCPFNCEHDIELLFQPLLTYIDGSGDRFGKIQDDYNDTLRGISSSRPGCPILNSGQNFTFWLNDDSGLNHFTTNGQLNPLLTIKAGEMKRFRMVNAGGSDILELEMVDNATGLHGCEYQEIALDGVYLDRPRRPRQNKTLLVSAGRADWLVRCNEPGTYIIRSIHLPVDNDSTGTNTRRFDGTLFTLQVNGPVQTGSIGTVPLPTRPPYVNFPTDTTLKTSFSIEVGPQLTLNRERFKGEHYFRQKLMGPHTCKVENNAIQQITMGKSGVVRHLVNVSEHVQWSFLNTVPTEGHPIHIHINHFKVVGYAPYNGPIGQVIDPNNATAWLLFSPDTTLDNRVCQLQHEGINKTEYSSVKLSKNTTLSYPHHEMWDKDVPGTVGYSQAGDYRDTIMVPPLSNITIQFIVDKFTDIVVIHCHFLKHEDLGMMMLVDIIDPEEGATMPVMPKSGDALPGDCIKSEQEVNEAKPTEQPGNGNSPGNGSNPQHKNRFDLMLLCIVSLIWW